MQVLAIADFLSFRYFYTDDITISANTVFAYLSAAKRFEMTKLEQLCVDQIAKDMKVENVCTYMNEAVNFNSAQLKEKCREIFSKQTAQVAIQQTFLQLSQPALSALLDVEQSNVLEVELFRLIKGWMHSKCKESKIAITGANMRHVIGDALYKIRFPTMTVQDFANSVVAQFPGLLTDSETAQIYKKITIFDADDIECPFSNTFRCQVNYYDTPWNDLDQLLKYDVHYNHYTEEYTDLKSMLHYMKDAAGNDEIMVTSLRTFLQCCADLANSSGRYVGVNDAKQKIASDILDDFKAFLDKRKTENVHEIMSKYMELRRKLNTFCGRHY
jgi:hypothetical protein